jgi:hypothetical protein
MIGCFPDPYPDELLYSIVARYQQRTRFSTNFINLELFGGGYEKHVIDLPTRLSILENNLPRSCPYNAIYFIEKNTLLPLYRPFISVFMKNVATDRMLYRFYKEASKYREWRSLRGDIRQNNTCFRVESWRRLGRRFCFCAECVVEDRQSFGETYWHRLHQIPYAKICPKHLTPILESSLEIFSGKKGSSGSVVETVLADTFCFSCIR